MSEQAGDLELTSKRRTGLGIRERLKRGRAISDDESDWQIARGGLPGGAAFGERRLQPFEL